MVGSQGTGLVSAQCTGPRCPEQCRHAWALSTALSGGWVGGPGRAVSYTKQVQVFHMGCYFSYLKRSLLSCLLTSQLCHPRPTATPHVTCVRPSPPSPPQNHPQQLAASPHPLECEFQRGRRWMWAVTLVPSPGLSEHGLGGSERSQAPLPSGNCRPRSARRRGALTALSSVCPHLPHSRGQVGTRVSGGGWPCLRHQCARSEPCSLSCFLTESVAHTLSPSFHPDLLPGLMSLGSSCLPRMGPSI